MPKYNKLIRDNIPEIISKDNKRFLIEYVNDEEDLYYYLFDKMQEEFQEFLSSGDVLELVDMVEVIITLAKMRGYDFKQFMTLRELKYVECGGFSNIILKYVED